MSTVNLNAKFIRINLRGKFTEVIAGIEAVLRGDHITTTEDIIKLYNNIARQLYHYIIIFAVRESLARDIPRAYYIASTREMRLDEFIKDIMRYARLGYIIVEIRERDGDNALYLAVHPGDLDLVISSLKPYIRQL